MPAKRINFGEINPRVKIPDLISIQKKSLAHFLQGNIAPPKRKQEGLQLIFEDAFPIKSYNENVVIEFLEYQLGEPTEEISECRRQSLSYECPLKAKLRLWKRNPKTNRYEGKESGEGIFICWLPVMTEKGSFIINGEERVIVNQLQRSPGVFFDADEEKKMSSYGKRLYTAKIIPQRGAWLEFEFDRDNALFVRIDRKRKVPVSRLLRAAGYGKDEQILGLFYEVEEISTDKAEGRIIAENIQLPGGENILLTEQLNKGLNLEEMGLAHQQVKLILKGKIKKIKVLKIDSAVNDITMINTVRADNLKTTEQAAHDIYQKLRVQEYITAGVARDFVNKLLFDPAGRRYDLGGVGRYKLNQRLNLKTSLNRRTLTKEDIIATIKYLVSLNNGTVTQIDDIDHLGNRRVKSIGELLGNQMRIGFLHMARLIREKINTGDLESVTLRDTINTAPVVAIIRSFFGGSQLSQFMDQTNLLAEITHKRRFSALGPGGLNRKRAGFEVRDVHYTQYGRICPVETPEGANIGLITSLATYADVNEYGFITTPYRKVVKGQATDKVAYLSAGVTDKYIIAQANTPLNEKGKILSKQVSCCHRDEFPIVSPEEVEYIDISPQQIVGLSAGLIPFLEHDDANRALMGSNMQRQAVPLLLPESPLIATGLESEVVKYSGDVVSCRRRGMVEYMSANKIVVDCRENEKQGRDKEIRQYFDIYELEKYRNSNQNTCINQLPIVARGQRVKVGDLLADGPATAAGELSLGRDLLVAFMPWEGYNFEDAILMNERVLRDDVFTSIHIQEFEVSARDLRHGNEEITRDIPNVGEESLCNLDEDGIVKIGSWVGPGNILVGKVVPRAHLTTTPEERLLSAIFGRKAEDVEDVSLRVPAGVEGTVIGIDVLSPKKESTVKVVQNINAHYQAKVEHLRQEAKREINELEKVAKENYKKEIQKIKLLVELETEELKSAKQKAIAKAHSGDKLPIGVNKTVKVRVAIKRPLTVGDKLSGRHGNKGVVSRILPEEDMPYLEDGTPVDIVLNPLSVPSRMNIGQLLETSLGWAAHWLGLKMTCPVFEGASEQQISEYIEKVNKIAEKVNKLKGPVAKIPVLDRAGKTVVYDGHTGEPFDQKVTVGYIYMMKLIHLAEEKMHARSIGPYALITRQPLGGKAQFGGQRLGEMEVWALEGYGAAYTLQEMLTLKSDDVFGRAKMYESIIKGELPFPAGIPESFKVLVKELQSLCLDIKLDGKSLFDSKAGEETFKNFKEIGISIASPEKIRKGSRGEVKKPATINYRTFKPERDGLFCERIFGPTHDYECSCGKYKYSRYKGQKCERCGVEITESKVRRERLGHIDLATPVAHTWFLRKPPSRIAALLEMPLDDIERVIYYAAFIVIEPGDTPLKKCQILTLEEYGNCKQKYGGKFKASTGAGAIRELLAEFSDPEKDVHLPKLRKQLYARLKKLQEKAKNLGGSTIANRKLLQRLNVVESFCRTGAQPEWMILQRVPVLPPDLRPLVSLEGGRFAASDLNDLYRRIINRNNRLKHVLELKAPEIMVSNEKRLLQEAVDVLFENGANGKTIVGPGKRPLKCLSDVLQGKRGRFRQNLLGKRVDYSGRAVIVVGPELKMGECGLPKRMAIELFKPFIIKELFQNQIVPSVKAAKRLLEFPTPEIWDVVEKVGKEHLVLLNRAPTLHRLSIQAFKPVLIDGSAIQLHPLVCVPFNADFDGDQMAVHVPISQEAQAEANFLMVSTGNLLSPAYGQPIISPTQDMVLGCYYLTIDKPEDIGEGMKFSDPSEVLLAYHTGEVGLHARIKVRSDGQLIDTTVGRVMFNDIIPKELGFINQPMDKKVSAGLVETCYRKLGNYRTMLLLDDLKRLGFKYATRSGLSIAVEDLKIPEEKEKLLQESDKEIEKVKQYYHQGEITDGERYQRSIDIWTHTTQKISRMMVKGLKEINEKPYVPGEDKFNSIYLLINSGARGTEEQVKQLAAIRGLMARPQKKILGLPGEIIEFPIRSNFREGLTVLEYFISTHGGRKGLADTALKTSDAGYLTRKLIDVSHNVVVSEEDCGTTDGITVSAIRDSEGRIIESLYKRILGRVSLKNIVDPFTDKVLVKENEIITEDSAERIELVGIEQVRIRSVLTCQAKRGVCSKCYGRDLATGKLVRTGTPAGIIAAQSIGEPGTQLTLRTFHIGGTAGQTIRQYSIQSDLDGKARFSNLRTLVNRDKKMINISRDAEVSIKPPGKLGQTYSIPYGATVFVQDGGRVKKGAQIAEWIPFMMPIIAETEGMAKFKDIVKGKTVYEEINKTTGLKERVIIEHREGKLHPQIVVVGKQGKERKYLLPMDTHIVVNNGDRIYKGDILAKIPQMVIQIKDITGGLPRVTELFEARRPRNAAIITEIDGKVHLSGTARRKFIVEVIPERGQKTSYSIPPGRHLVVYENDWVRAGEQLTDGSIDPHDILKVKGVKEAQEYLVNQVQATYTLQGVNINDKHIETIVRRMFDKVLVTEKGDSDFLPGERVDKFKFTQQNDRLSKQGKSPASASPLLLGITHAALESESFVSGSSFQETSSVLTEASVKGKADPLEGLKENVIIGRLIPAGTGMPNYRQVKLE